MRNKSFGRAMFSIVAAVTILILLCVWLINRAGMDVEVAIAGIYSPYVKIKIITKTGNNEDIFEVARQKFEEKNKNIKIEFISMSSGEGIDYICKNGDADAWVCADETVAELLTEKYSLVNNNPSVIIESAPIVTSPLIIVGWEERIKKILSSGEFSIDRLYDIIAQNKSWESLYGDSKWGRVRFSHTDPQLSNSAVQFIAILCDNFYRGQGIKKDQLKVADIENPAFYEYLSKFEKNITGVQEGSGKLIDSMVLYGPSKYDFSAIYEYYALSNIKNAKNKWGNMKIIYPNPTIWSKKSFLILKGSQAKPSKIEACKKFEAFLLSEEIQKYAMKEGYRPANTAVSDFNVLENEYAQYGFKKEVPNALDELDIYVYKAITAMHKKILME